MRLSSIKNVKTKIFPEIRLFLLALLLAIGLLLMPVQAEAACSVPNSISNGQVADATAVMGNFNALKDCANANVSPSGTPAAGNLTVFSGAGTVTNGNLSGDVSTSGGTTTTLSNSGVTPGIYTNPEITVDAKGRVTAAANGGVGSGGGGLTLISRQVLAATAATIDFSAIPSTYEDLVLVVQARCTASVTGCTVLLRFNNDGGSNYDYSRWNRWGSDSNGGQTAGQVGTATGASADSFRATDLTLEIPNYKRNSFFKSSHAVSSWSGGTTAALQGAEVTEMIWRSTATINQITLSLTSTGSFAAGSVASLYGRQ